MDFRSLLVEKDTLGTISYRIFKAITPPGCELQLSIQASELHYCSPRITSSKLEVYESWEITIMDSNGEFHSPKNDPRIPLSIAECWQQDLSVTSLTTSQVQWLYDSLTAN